jgi:hypothetical protein
MAKAKSDFSQGDLWQPCLLTNRDEISSLYRGPSIDASYQILVHLAITHSVVCFFYFDLFSNHWTKLGLWVATILKYI